MRDPLFAAHDPAPVFQSLTTYRYQIRSPFGRSPKRVPFEPARTVTKLAQPVPI